TIEGPHGAYVNLDLRHLGKKKLLERLPQIYEMAMEYQSVDPAEEPIPVLPAVHYTMGGIEANSRTGSRLPGLYSVGECSSIGIHGANRLGSNSLTELCVFGKVAGEEAAAFSKSCQPGNTAALEKIAADIQKRVEATVGNPDGTERVAVLREEMMKTMEEGCGIYRTGDEMQATMNKLAELRDRYKRVKVEDTGQAWNTERLLALELGYLLEVSEAVVHSAFNRKESRGSHQRIDGYEERDDENFLKHSLAFYNADGEPRIEYSDVTITKSKPGIRAYGAAGEKAEQDRKNEESGNG
ncbi:MAG: FAD-binding protein, partial [Pseudomonadales bacterium]|nr:FAD-binding protein [Pseudomonadales bacterium]